MSSDEKAWCQTQKAEDPSPCVFRKSLSAAPLKLGAKSTKAKKILEEFCQEKKRLVQFPPRNEKRSKAKKRSEDRNRNPTFGP